MSQWRPLNLTSDSATPFNPSSKTGTATVTSSGQPNIDSRAFDLSQLDGRPSLKRTSKFHRSPALPAGSLDRSTPVAKMESFSSRAVATPSQTCPMPFSSSCATRLFPLKALVPRLMYLHPHLAGTCGAQGRYDQYLLVSNPGGNTPVRLPRTNTLHCQRTSSSTWRAAIHCF